MRRDLAFSKGTPSIFVLSSPLQVICALEAINNFEIFDYKIILMLIDDIRNNQIFELCSQYGLKYEIAPVFYNKSEPLKKRKNKYKRVFIGDPRSIGQLYLAYINCSDGAAFVMLDDGDDNIFMLKGYSFFKDKSLRVRAYVYYYNKIIPLFRGISYGRDLFTIYSNIQNPQYRCVENAFKFVSKHTQTNSDSSGIYFIGTNYNKYCEEGNYPLNVVCAGLDSVLKKLRIKNPQDRIIYIPHGRDNEKFPIEICDKYDVIYQRPSKTVELMFLEQGVIPKEVYGFTSTALYNIKLLFPKSLIYNVTFNVNHSNTFIMQTEVISEYYKQHGISEIRL